MCNYMIAFSPKSYSGHGGESFFLSSHLLNNLLIESNVSDEDDNRGSGR